MLTCRKNAEKVISELSLENKILLKELENKKIREEEEKAKQERNFEHYKENCEIRYQLEFQKRENEWKDNYVDLKDRHKEELDKLRGELEQYKEWHYQNQKMNMENK